MDEKITINKKEYGLLKICDQKPNDTTLKEYGRSIIVETDDGKFAVYFRSFYADQKLKEGEK